MRSFSRIVLGVSILALGSLPSLAQQRSVALTFDDLPVAGTSDPVQARSINMSILDSLDRHHAPAIGFVIERRVQEVGRSQGTELLDQWVRRGYELGNHTLSHAEMNDLTVEHIEQEIIGGEGAFVAALAHVGKTPRYFRFPRNHTGDTKEKHDAVAAFLAKHGYKVAVCTIDNEDYIFDTAYRSLLSKHDEASAARLRAAYLDYTSTEIDYYSGLHKQIFGREIPHVMVLHVNKLNADLIDKVLELFQQKQYRFVSLDEALSDPGFKTPDTFFTQYGWMWGYRWAKELGVKVNGSLESEPPAWVLQYGQEQK